MYGESVHHRRRFQAKDKKMEKIMGNEKYKLIEDEIISDSEDEIIHNHGKTADHEVIETDDDTVTLIHHGGQLLHDDHADESFLSISVQILFPFLIAGLGMVGAGIVLDIVQHWTVFETVNEIFILVPALLGLKGNLEMTLASRLSTQVKLACVIMLIHLLKD